MSRAEHRLTDLEGRMSGAEAEQSRTSERMKVLTDHLNRIDKDLDEIKRAVVHTATKADLHREINGVLGKAFIAFGAVTAVSLVMALVHAVLQH
ncbi:MAG: hypothetical protein KGL35_04600 [Bradyrhizobium sp.]|nr:hypothetical protein [Bradyrhizobium sp.]